MANPLRFGGSRALNGVADILVSNPVTRMGWVGPLTDDYLSALDDFRPADRHAVREMMDGRYLFADRFVDTRGDSPFAEVDVSEAWMAELQSFGWLRHFRDARSAAENEFARQLTLSWIRLHGRFTRHTWGVRITAQRVLNWLRATNVILEGAPPAERAQISRSITHQVQSLRLRGSLTREPADRLMAALAVLGASLSARNGGKDVSGHLDRVQMLLAQQIDEDGLHRSRSAATQVMLLVELTTLHHALARAGGEYANELSDVLDGMHLALDAVSLSNGMPAYFNGTGPLPQDVFIALKGQNITRARSTGTTGGYGRLLWNGAVVVADAGAVPEPEYTAELHAGALAFEFSRSGDLIAGNCGPAPVDVPEEILKLRLGPAHSGITINEASAAAIPRHGPLAGRVVPLGPEPDLVADASSQSMLLVTHGFERRFGVTIERRLTLLKGGKSLLGQDRLGAVRRRLRAGLVCARFHLHPQTQVQVDAEAVQLRLLSGAAWTFFWEGAEMRVEDSLRHSPHVGLQRTQQIVLEAPVADEAEISWIFAFNEG